MPSGFESNVTLGVNVFSSAAGQPVAFLETVTLKSNVAATAVQVVTDAAVGPSRSAYLTGIIAKVNGSTTWLGTVSIVRILDSANNLLATIPVASLLGNATIFQNSVGVTLSPVVTLTQGTAIGTGIKVVADANASIGGSDLVITLQGVIK